MARSLHVKKKINYPLKRHYSLTSKSYASFSSLSLLPAMIEHHGFCFMYESDIILLATCLWDSCSLVEKEEDFV